MSNIETLLKELLEEVRDLRTRTVLPEVLNKDRAAQMLGGISVATLNRMIREGRIQTCALGNREGAGIPRSEIERAARPTPVHTTAPRGKRGRKPQPVYDPKAEAAALRDSLKKR